MSAYAIWAAPLSIDLQKRIHCNNMNASNAFLRGDAMAMLTVRNVPDNIHRALRVRAAQHGHSTEAEVRAILASAVMPEARVCMGDALANLSRALDLTNEDFEAFGTVRDRAEAKPWSFE
jgi:plasmid stability protein